MERRSFQSPLGEAWLWGSSEAFDGGKPVILVIHGAFQLERTSFFDLPPYFPDAAVICAHLPGNHCPELTSPSIAAYAQALDHVWAKAFPNRPTIACGVSTGGLVALAMEVSELRSMVLIEPPLKTGKLWPLIGPLRERAQEAPWAARFVEKVFGYYPDHIEGRDYSPLLGGLSRPAYVLLGEVPLMPERPLSELPSLVDDPERALLEAHPCVRLAVSPGVGHDIPQHHDKLIDAALARAMSLSRAYANSPVR